MFYNSDDPAERKSFFWTFYRPMITAILDEQKAFPNNNQFLLGFRN